MLESTSRAARQFGVIKSVLERLGPAGMDKPSQREESVVMSSRRNQTLTTGGTVALALIIGSDQSIPAGLQAR